MKIPSYTFLLILITALSCSIFNNEQSDSLEFNKAKWERLNIQNYEFVEQNQCFCYSSGPKIIVVTEGEVTDVLDAETRERIMIEIDSQQIPILEAMPDNFFAIDGYFEIIESTLETSSTLEYSFDTKYGHPSLISIDAEQLAYDGGIIHNITNLKKK